MGKQDIKNEDAGKSPPQTTPVSLIRNVYDWHDFPECAIIGRHTVVKDGVTTVYDCGDGSVVTVTQADGSFVAVNTDGSPDVYTAEEAAKLRMDSDAFIKSLSPEDAVFLYYSVLNYQPIAGACPELIPSEITPDHYIANGTAEWFELNIRQKIYRLRPDLHHHPLTGDVILIDPAMIPKWNGLKCQAPMYGMILTMVMSAVASWAMPQGLAFAVSLWTNASTLRDQLDAAKRTRGLLELRDKIDLGITLSHTLGPTQMTATSIPESLTSISDKATTTLVPINQSAASSPSALWPILIAVGVALMN